MKDKMFHYVVSILLGVLGVVHGLRFVYGWEAEVGGWVVPVWASAIAGVIALDLAWRSFKLADRSRSR
jgi:hypothetical protein